ncbi:hypothetical protein [Sphingobacterium griseoflavum]|uniref:hypothetical protein n=1 Tax=Sphingobacterium griseoflavum TaxID=1474952 RepID=UPI00167361C5|nr:hypothetical protein [Sphingobacterium griseoflavum]
MKDQFINEKLSGQRIASGRDVGRRPIRRTQKQPNRETVWKSRYFIIHLPFGFFW